jgi:hypothetical protein
MTAEGAVTRAKRILACLPLSLFNFTTHFGEVSGLDKFPSLIAKKAGFVRTATLPLPKTNQDRIVRTEN